MSQPNRSGGPGTEADLLAERAELQVEVTRLRSEVEVREALLREVMEASHVGIVVRPRGGGAIANARAADFVGSEGAPPTPLLRPDGSALRPEELPVNQALRGETVVDREVQRVGPDGSMVSMLVNAHPVRDSAGTITHAIATYQDLQPHPRVNEFLADLSHELRTPMSSILGWARLLSDNQVPAQKRLHGMAVIQRNAARQLQLIDDLLDTSLLFTGHLPLAPQPINPEAIVGRALESVHPLAATKGIRMSAQVSPECLDAVLDPDRFHQLVWNLLANAIRATGDNGTVDLRVSRAGSELRVEVTDTGEGIEPSVLPYIFDRFTPAGSELTRRRGKVGVGLAMMKPVIDRQGGTIQALSKGVGQGTTFVVTLPMRPATASVASSIGGTEAIAPSPILTGRTVLVVEDESDTRDLIQAVLQATSARVVTASDGVEALQQLAQTNVDLVVSDVGMPRSDGYDMVRLIRLAEGAGAHLPVVALTALAQEADRARALEAGFDVHLAKPVDPRKLINLVASLLAGKDLGGENSGLKN